MSILSAVSFALVLVVFATFMKQRSGSNRKLPPGPPKIPFFGNLFQFSAMRPYPKFREWALQYGPIYHLRLGPQNVIVLNKAEIADELFVNRSKIYSGRAAPHVAHDIMSAGQRQVFLPYEKEWKTARKSVQSAIGGSASRRVRPIQEMEARVLLYDLLCHGAKSITEPQIPGPRGEVPEGHWFSLIRRYMTSVVLYVTYGKRAHKIFDNPRLHKIYAVLANLTDVAQPGNYLADAFPILRKLPDFLAPWRVQARKMHEWEMELWGGFLGDIQTELRNGTETVSAASSYVGNYLKQRTEHGWADAPGCGLTPDGEWQRDTLLAYSAATILEAGSDTTASTILAFVLLMISHPAVLQKAREEIDRVVTASRMPSFEDEEDLPYLVACIKETLRRRPPTVMGIPHGVEEDDFYEGYLIPKGSTVIGNIWAIHMDPTRFPNPMAFQPERFYTPGKPTRWKSGPDNDRDVYVFGWGRRYCQGSHISEASLFITLSRILWAFDILPPVDPKTNIPIIPDLSQEEVTFTTGFVTGPVLYGVEWKVRSEEKAQMILRSFEETQAAWSELGLEKDER